jgi:hypothetical protein
MQQTTTSPNMTAKLYQGFGLAGKPNISSVEIEIAGFAPDLDHTMAMR